MNIRPIASVLQLRRRVIAYLMLGLANIGLFAWTTPLESPAVIVIAGFLVASLDIWVLTRFMIRFLGVMTPTVHRFERRLTTALVSFGVVALAMASLGQLTWRDSVVVLIIWVLGYLYSLRFNLGVRR